jgi:nucleolar GTP-binding protein
LDIAFRRAYRATPHGTGRLDRARRRALLKIVRSTAVVVRQLRLRTHRFRPPGITEFDGRLIGQRFGIGTLARCLARVRTAEQRVRELSRLEQVALRRLGTEAQFGESVRRCYGRLASFLREIDPDLKRLEEISRFLDARPRLSPEVPTVVVAGFPNVGKSSLVARLSSARPEIADYPFTTLAISVGHADLGFDRMQVVDTPGVLGRRGRANPAESEAIAAVGGVAHLILFVLDPTEECGYSLVDQEALLARWRLEFLSTPFLEVETKADLPRPSSARLQVSATTGVGLEELRARIQETLSRVAKTLARPEPLPEEGEVPEDEPVPE